jgi:hypothetical protein
MMTGRTYGTKGRVVCTGQDSSNRVNCCTGCQPRDVGRLGTEHRISFDATTSGSSKSSQFLQVFGGVHQLQICVRGWCHRAASHPVQQAGSLQMLFKDGNTNRTFRVFSGLMTLKAGI